MRDTICALATPPGQSALAIIRMSGPEALNINARLFKPKSAPQKHFVATRGDVADLDDGICITFPEGKSFTGEPCVEYTLHGSPVVIQQVLEQLRRLGVRTANPGEFSLRAFLSGKIDLCEAEAIADLIHARSEQAAKAALKNLKGALAEYLEPTRITLVDALCEIEARLDFPDEDLGSAQRDRLEQALTGAIETLAKLLSSAKIGRRLMDGARIVLVGLPNAGKSTLLNALLGEDKALVHDMPGTTRDVIEAAWVLGGIPVTLVDVAGIREAADLDPVERLGIEKAKRELERADLILWLEEPGQEADIIPAGIATPILKVSTKADQVTASVSTLSISAKTGDGLSELKTRLAELLVGSGTDLNETMLTKIRQKDEVQKAKEFLMEALYALNRAEPDEIVAFELRGAGQALDRLLGKSLNEDVLDLIFSRFCIGK
ncbi:MAG: tRNA uridine-5-carboxymethylaminomethyl(34) synthesis GTPase MnmE [Myxococcota bacterium]